MSMMRVIQNILGLLLAVVLALTATLFGINHFNNADYFYSISQESNLNDAVSGIITTRLAEINKNNSGESSPTVDQALGSAVSKQFLESKNHEITRQLESVLRGKKDSIEVDLSELASMAQAAGLNVNSVDIAPLKIDPPKAFNSRMEFVLQRIQFFAFIGTVATGIMLIALAVITLKSGYRLPLVISFVVSAGLLGLFSLALGILIDMRGSNLELPATLNSLQIPLQNFVMYVKEDMQRWYQSVAAALLILGCVLWAIDYGLLRNRDALVHRDH